VESQHWLPDMIRIQLQGQQASCRPLQTDSLREHELSAVQGRCHVLFAQAQHENQRLTQYAGLVK